MQSFLRTICVSVLLISGGIENVFSDVKISKMAGSWPIEITSCDHDAGAICSLTWRNKEFINDKDRGRQLQSAANFSPVPEGYNPTEAGSLIDGEYISGALAYPDILPKPNHLFSSSELQGRWATSNVLATYTKMALFAMIQDPNGELTHDSVKKTVMSNHFILKQVTIGAHGLAHVIEYLTEFRIPDETLPHNHGVFEVVTGYMPSEFSSFWTFNIPTRKLTKLSTEGEQGLPLIFSTADGGWAMGIYSPGTPQSATGSLSRLGYGAFSQPDHPEVVKWNNVYRHGSPQGRNLHYRSYVIVGSLNNVKTSMIQLRNVLDGLGY